MLIETLYGYSKQWVLEGIEPKKIDMDKTNIDKIMNPLQRSLVMEIEKMSDTELRAVLCLY